MTNHFIKIFLTWAIFFLIFIEFVTILILFYASVFLATRHVELKLPPELEGKS